MKSRLLSALAASLLLLGAGRLAAQSQPSSSGAQPRYNSVDEAIARREIAERMLFLDQANKIYRDDTARNQAIFTSLKASTYDVNHDGKLDDHERAAWEKRLRIVLGRTPEFMRKYDADHDNILSNAEWDVAYAAIFEPKASAPAPARSGS